MTTRNGFRVDDVPGSRWALALGIIEDAGPSVFIDGEVTVGIQRWDGWKGADGRIHIGIYTTRSPDQLTEAIAAKEVSSGLEILSRLIAVDERLRRLFDLHGTEITYLNDYGMGAAALARVSDDGSLAWIEGLQPLR